MTKLKKGSFTVEAAVVIPMLLFTVGIIMLLLFYCHDKNVLEGAVSEAGIVASGRSGKENYDTLVGGKLLWFQNPEIEAEEKDGYVLVTAKARRKLWKIEVQTKVAVTKPETFIRDIRRIQ